MSLRLASLDAYTLLERVFASDYGANPAISDMAAESYRPRGELRHALGVLSKSDNDLNAIGLLETIAESLARDPDTALLAGAIVRAIGQHRAGAELHSLVATE